MRIELSSGGLSSGVTISDFYSDFDSLIGKTKKIASSFQKIQSFSYNMNGGVGVLQDAVSQIESRLTAEKEKVIALEQVRKKVDNFVESVKQTDFEVDILVTKNKNEFYRVNPWAKPPPRETEKKWYNHVGEWLGDRYEEAKEGFNRVKDTVVSWGKSAADTISKCWNSIKEWCIEYKDTIKGAIIRVAIGGLVIAGLALLTVATGGTASVFFAPMIGSMIGGLVGAGVGAGSSIIKYRFNTDSNEYSWKEMLGEGLSGAASGFMTGTITGAVSGAAPGITGGLSKGVATITGGGLNSAATAVSETIDKLLEDGSLQGDLGEIALSSVISFGFGSYGTYKNYGSDSLASISKFQRNYKNVVNDEIATVKSKAIEAMKQNLTGENLKENVILQAQEQLKNLEVFTELMDDVISDTITDTIKGDLKGNLWDSFKEELVSNIINPF